MGKLLHFIADFRPSGIDVGEVVQRLYARLPAGWQVWPTAAAPLSTVETGFAVYQYACAADVDRPEDMAIFANCAPRRDDCAPRKQNAGEPLLYAKLKNGVRVFGVNSGFSLSFVRSEIAQLREVKCAAHGSQFRTRDVFAPVVAAVLSGDASLLGAPLEPEESIAELPSEPMIVSVDGFGLCKLWGLHQSPNLDRLLADGVRVRLIFGSNGHDPVVATVAKGIFSVDSGEFVLAPGSSGHNGYVFWEAGQRDGNLWEHVGCPERGCRVRLERTHD